MTQPPLSPGMPPRPPVTARPGRLTRWKLTEPVRLYAYTVLAAVLLALVLVGTITDEWADALLGVAAAVLAVVPGAEAARASVYSPAGTLTAIRRAVDSSATGSALEVHGLYGDPR